MAEFEEAPEIDFFDPARIPDTSWDNIFKYVDVFDLKNLSLVSKVFYDMIGMSKESMDRVLLVLHPKLLNNPENREILINSSRIYRAVVVNHIREHPNIYVDTNFHHFMLSVDTVDIDVNNLFEILRKFGSNVRYLRMVCNQFTKMEMIEILKCTSSKLEFLHIRFVGQLLKKEEEHQHSQQSHENFKFFKLVTLKIEFLDSGLCDTLWNLLPDSIVTLSFFSVKNTQFGTFLVTQKNVKHLRMRAPFSHAIDSTKLGFQLETLALGCRPKHGENDENYYVEFLTSQAGSLKQLKLIDLPIHEYFSMFENLPNLEDLFVENRNLQRFSCPILFSCPRLKKLMINFEKHRRPLPSPYSNFIEKFPQVPEIVIKRVISRELLQKIAETCRNLKKITFYRFYYALFKNVVFDQVKELVIDNWDQERISYHRGRAWTMEYVFAAFQNLKILKTQKTLIVSSMDLQWLLEGFENLEHLEIENGSQIRMTILRTKSYLFKNLKSLKIWQIGADVAEFQDFFCQYSGLHYDFKREVAKYEDYDDDNDYNI